MSRSRRSVAGRARRAFLAVVLPILVLALLPGKASAASIPSTPTFTGGGPSTTILSALAVCDSCAPDGLFSGGLGTYGLGAGVQVQAQATWSNPSTLTTQYTPGLLRQGQTLNTSNTLTPGPGTVTVNYSVSGFAGIYTTSETGSNESCATTDPGGCNGWEQTTDGIGLGPIAASDTIPCTMPLPGDSPVLCSKTFSIPLLTAGIPELGSAEVDLDLYESVTVTSTGMSSVRIGVVPGGQSIPNNTLNFNGPSPSTVHDPIAISCTQPAGTDLTYSLTQIGYQADPANFTGGLGFELKATVLLVTVGDIKTGQIVGSPPVDLGPITMSTDPLNLDLGPVLPNNIPPTVDVGPTPYSGNEGTPITFDASSSTSPCGLSNLSFVWNFSDGGVAYGVNPQHTFGGPGTYSGELTATDANGNVGHANFSVTVADVAPVANAGPNVSTAWGVPITLNGSGVAGGTSQQPVLRYSWDFGDGTPSASGGPSVSHVYATPGHYTATLTVCDPVATTPCGVSTTQVTVRTRGTTLSYTGVTASDVTDPATLKASLTDDQGAAVVGRTVQFFEDGSLIASASTNAAGKASVVYPFPLGQVGTHTIVATLAGDTYYTANQSTAALFSVSQDGTILTYTGPATSKPSKTVAVTAHITDDMSRPLAGLAVSFSLGTQSCNTTTNASGVASCTIPKLNQKPGNYTITASFTGSANYLASSANAGFTIA